MYVQVNIASSCSVLLKRLISLDRYAFYFSALHSDSAPWSLLLASRNKSFVLLGKFASAIRSAYKCGNKICLLLPPSLFQPLPYPLQHFTLSFTFFHSLAPAAVSLSSRATIRALYRLKGLPIRKVKLIVFLRGSRVFRISLSSRLPFTLLDVLSPVIKINRSRSRK